MMTRPILAALLGLAVATAQQPLSIMSFGAVPWNNTQSAGLANGLALYNAMQAANSGVNGNVREVVVPAYTNFTIIPHAPLIGMRNVKLTIDGNLIAWLPPSGNSSYWPVDSRGTALDVIAFWQSQGVEITTHFGTFSNGTDSSGWGIIDGQGYDWWWYVLLSTIDNRPNLIGMASVLGPITITGLRMVNSPEYHAFLHDIKDAYISDVDIFVNVEAQQSLLGQFGHLTTGEGFKEVERLKRQLKASPSSSRVAKRIEDLLETFDKEGALPAGIPTFPLNTDGIDPAGTNVTITRTSITNFDDAIAVKPLHASPTQVSGNCSQNMYFSHCKVKFGVGMTIGSVPPNTAVACVKNITFTDITFESPIKGIYIKPNPPIGYPSEKKEYADSWERKSDFSSIFAGSNSLLGNDDPSDDPTGTPLPSPPPHPDSIGTGIIDQITYQNIYGSGSIWWSIYVGLQQQKQPGNGTDTGCSFWYPIFNSTCPLQPRVPVTNLVLQNVTFLDSILSPGIMRCANATEGAGYPGFRPCSGWVFEDVVMTSILNWPITQEEGGYLCHGLDNPVFNGTSNPIPKCT